MRPLKQELSATAKRHLTRALTAAQAAAPTAPVATLVKQLKPVIDQLEVSPAAARSFIKTVSTEQRAAEDHLALVSASREARARAEWNQAPDARGYAPALGLRELVTGTEAGPYLDSAPVTVRTALTFDQWMRHRTAQLHEQATQDTWNSDTHYSDGYPRPRR